MTDYVAHLPPESVLDGHVRGPKVTFLKTYRGLHYGGFRMGEVVVGHHDEDHTVHYRGTLSPRGDEIEGKWWIDQGPEPGARRAEGSFLLRRRDG
jgi:hypothetical protein